MSNPKATAEDLRKCRFHPDPKSGCLSCKVSILAAAYLEAVKDGERQRSEKLRKAADEVKVPTPTNDEMVIIYLAGPLCGRVAECLRTTYGANGFRLGEALSTISLKRSAVRV